MNFSVGITFNHLDVEYIDFICQNSRIDEVFFSLPGDSTARYLESPSMNYSLVCMQNYLNKLKKNNKKLNLLLNSTLFLNELNIDAISVDLNKKLQLLKSGNCFPDIITTISPFIASILKNKYPFIERRLSVINNLGTQQGFEYCKDFFDSFYVNPLMNRKYNHIKGLYNWCKDNKKKLGLLINSHCLADCPFHFAHYSHISTMTGKNYSNEEFKQFPICPMVSKDKKITIYNVLRGSWIRPEDLKNYEDICDIIKISTRTAKNPLSIVKAYLNFNYTGNLIDLLDCDTGSKLYLQNKKFPVNYFQTLNNVCDRNCIQCGYCKELSKTFV